MQSSQSPEQAKQSSGDDDGDDVDFPSSPSPSPLSPSSTTATSASRPSCCRCLPHGPYSLFVATFAVMGWMAALLQSGCEMAVVEGPVVQQLYPTFNENPLTMMEFGFEVYRLPVQVNATYVDPFGGRSSSSEQQCAEYPPELTKDTIWVVAQLLSFVALVLGGGGSVFVWCSTCFVFSKGTWKWTGYVLLLACGCQVGSFIWYKSHICSWNTCTMSSGSKLDAISALFWFCSSFMVICRYPRPYNQYEHIQQDQYQQQHRRRRQQQQQQQHDLDLEIVSSPFSGRNSDACGDGGDNHNDDDDDDDIQISGEHTTEGVKTNEDVNGRDGIMMVY